MNALNEDLQIVRKEFIEYVGFAFQDLKGFILDSKDELKKDIKKIDDKVANLRTELKGEIQGVKTELKDEMGSIRHDMRIMESRLEIKINTNTLAIADMAKDLKPSLKNKERVENHEIRITNLEEREKALLK